MEDLNAYQEPLTPEQARTVKLSWNPIKRLGQIARLGEPFGLVQVGGSPLPQYFTRHDLIRHAESLARAKEEYAATENTCEPEEL